MDLKEQTMEMKNWAVVGASDDKDSYGYKIVKRLSKNGYNVYPVNPKLSQIDGLTAYTNLKNIPYKVDVVDIVVRPEIAIKAMKKVKEEGIKYVWLQPGTRSDEIRKYAKENDIELVENCIYESLG